MREHRLIQRRRPSGRRRPGSFRVEYPDQLWQLDMTSVWVAAVSGLGIAHRRGGDRDPESQAFIESWFGKLKERCVSREEFDTLDRARQAIGDDVDRYHDRPHSRLNYNTPREVAATWNDGGLTHLIPAARTANTDEHAT
jgi:transposase InsO family protein